MQNESLSQPELHFELGAPFSELQRYRTTPKPQAQTEQICNSLQTKTELRYST